MWLHCGTPGQFDNRFNFPHASYYQIVWRFCKYVVSWFKLRGKGVTALYLKQIRWKEPLSSVILRLEIRSFSFLAGVRFDDLIVITAFLGAPSTITITKKYIHIGLHKWLVVYNIPFLLRYIRYIIGLQ